MCSLSFSSGKTKILQLLQSQDMQVLAKNFGCLSSTADVIADGWSSIGG